MTSKIVQLANFYSPTSGGLRVAVDALRNGYVAAGSSTTLIIPGRRSHSCDGVVEIAAPKLPTSSGYRVIVSRRAVLDALDHADPDLVEVHDKLLQRWAWQWAQRRHRPLVAFSHERLDATLGEFLPRLGAGPRERLVEFVNSRALGDCDRLVTCSAFAAAEFPASAKIRTVPLGVDLDRFRPVATAGSNVAVQLVSVGRLSPEKRPDIAIGAVAALLSRGVRAELTMLGSGPWESRLRRQAGSLPVRFLGFCAPEQVAEHLAVADISLACGPAETFGLAALEALACGTPTVTVLGAATADFVSLDPAAGRAVAANSQAFADAVLELLVVPVPTRRRAARAVAERFSWKHTIDAMRDLQAELLATGRVLEP
ncbi:MAG TPA: glycosyltransferase [Jatrophihabitans sp.]|jgi:alpha-1,6-mannosyltransferase